MGTEEEAKRFLTNLELARVCGVHKTTVFRDGIWELAEWKQLYIKAEDGEYVVDNQKRIDVRLPEVQEYIKQKKKKKGAARKNNT